MSNYYDIEIDLEELLQQADCVDQYFYLQDLKQRKLFLDGEITQTYVSGISRHIMQMNKEDVDIAPAERKPILLYVTSVGGSLDSGFELIDVIRASKTPVYTINLGFQYSMGFLIGLAGHKRFATPNAKFLMHDGSIITWDSGAKAHDQMEFHKAVEQRIRSYVISRSKVTAEEYDDKYRVEWYMMADEAKEHGFTDYIIGEDCDLDAVI